ncbi:hypothetical protein [Candidatus Nanopelagicus hibericus]|uniref:hypothetical protein n=1 Tax=Candidatus Nanopelagicus hibericus TaxID=1884915 RepID=UPI00167FE15A|nr:hypothetical protein [Candidatus Nanopelagicus hibericus]
MGQIIEFPCCLYCHSNQLGIFLTGNNNPMVMCDECGYACRASIEHFDQPLTKVSIC